MLDWRRRYDESQSRGLYAQRMLLLAAAGVVAIMIFGYLGHALNRFGEFRSVDTRFAVRGSNGRRRTSSSSRSTTRRSATCASSGRSRAGTTRRSIDRIAAGHPKAIAIDIDFTQPTTAANDNALIDSVARRVNVVLAATEVNANGRRRSSASRGT